MAKRVRKTRSTNKAVNMDDFRKQQPSFVCHFTKLFNSAIETPHPQSGVTRRNEWYKQKDWMAYLRKSQKALDLIKNGQYLDYAIAKSGCTNLTSANKAQIEALSEHVSTLVLIGLRLKMDGEGLEEALIQSFSANKDTVMKLLQACFDRLDLDFPEKSEKEYRLIRHGNWTIRSLDIIPWHVPRKDDPAGSVENLGNAGLELINTWVGMFSSITKSDSVEVIPPHNGSNSQASAKRPTRQHAKEASSHFIHDPFHTVSDAIAALHDLKENCIAVFGLAEAPSRRLEGGNITEFVPIPGLGYVGGATLFLPKESDVLSVFEEDVQSQKCGVQNEVDNVANAAAPRISDGAIRRYLEQLPRQWRELATWEGDIDSNRRFDPFSTLSAGMDGKPHNRLVVISVASELADTGASGFFRSIPHKRISSQVSWDKDYTQNVIAEVVLCRMRHRHLPIYLFMDLETCASVTSEINRICKVQEGMNDLVKFVYNFAQTRSEYQAACTPGEAYASSLAESLKSLRISHNFDSRGAWSAPFSIAVRRDTKARWVEFLSRTQERMYAMWPTVLAVRYARLITRYPYIAPMRLSDSLTKATASVFAGELMSALRMEVTRLHDYPLFANGEGHEGMFTPAFPEGAEQEAQYEASLQLKRHAEIMLERCLTVWQKDL